MLYLGVDHHKQFSYLKVMDEAGRVKKEARVNNTRPALKGFLGGLGSEPIHAVMEAGRNWTVMYDWLEEEVDQVKLAYPLKVKAIADAKIKTDKVDAGTLAHLLRCDLIPEAPVSSAAGREAKNILRRRMFLVRLQTMVKNRIHTAGSAAGDSGWSEIDRPFHRGRKATPEGSPATCNGPKAAGRRASVVGGDPRPHSIQRATGAAVGQGQPSGPAP